MVVGVMAKATQVAAGRAKEVDNAAAAWMVVALAVAAKAKGAVVMLADWARKAVAMVVGVVEEDPKAVDEEAIGEGAMSEAKWVETEVRVAQMVGGLAEVGKPGRVGAEMEPAGTLGRAGAVMEPAVMGVVVTALVGLEEAVVPEVHLKAELAAWAEVRGVTAGVVVDKTVEGPAEGRVVAAAAVAVAQEGMGHVVATVAKSVAARKELAAAGKPVVERKEVV